MKKILLLSVTAGFLFGFGGMRPSFNAIDKNGDRKISKSEFNRFKAKRSSMMERAGRMMKHAKRAPSFSRLDSNGDGFISRSEFNTMRRMMGR
jgi:Ca2+-binding EF-hand superfamily protein